MSDAVLVKKLSKEIKLDKVRVKLVKESKMKLNREKINSPLDAYDVIREYFDYLDREHAVLICLNTLNEPINFSVVSIGTLSKALLSPREIFKTALLSNSASIILTHNHPSSWDYGTELECSDEDITVTRRIKEAGEILGIKLLDHIVIGNNDYYSMRENNHL